MRTYFLVLAGAMVAFLWSSQASADPWGEEKSTHFIVYYESQQDRSVAKSVLRSAEQYYKKIADDIGYTRYSNFWTWEERVKILMFKDQITFLRTTGQPSWSGGYAGRDDHLFKSRAIVTFKQEHGFVDGLLPHEISHLVLHDFVPVANIPIWFDEGVAQLYESEKGVTAKQFMSVLVRQGSFLPLGGMANYDIRKEREPNRVMIYYSQSLSVVQFLVNKYGTHSFQRLCRELREGKSFEEALRIAYENRIQSYEDLQEKWANSMK